ncbi:MAG TPA: signal recognition particle-docking protein FtsY [Spirochaetia bacterium]|nr:signal recognition particle-docking protein FtsY [Spirochaetia bacterium]
MVKKSFGARLKELFAGVKTDEELLDELEEILIEGDIGASTAQELLDGLSERILKDKLRSRDAYRSVLKEMLKKYILSTELSPDPEKLSLYLMLGVNGVGKTTNLAKLAYYYLHTRNIKPLLAAADTFRAAAADQLKIHGERIGVRVVSQLPGADPGAVIYDSIESAKGRGERLVLVDTAGRMHTKDTLVRELKKIDKVITNRIDPSCYRKILVIDATTGQNGMRQAEIFHEAIGIDAVLLAKYDSASRGGIVISICRNLGIPIAFVGTGEGYEDIHVFQADEYLDGLLDAE